jgi:hypothetical protein
MFEGVCFKELRNNTKNSSLKQTPSNMVVEKQYKKYLFKTNTFKHE